MKQYIKKALWIIPFVFSLNLSAQYFFSGTVPSGGYGDGATKANWKDVSGNSPSSFTNVTLHLNNKDVDIAGCEFYSGVSITNYSTGTTSKIRNSGLVRIMEDLAPTFGTTNITYEFDQQGEFEYSAPYTSYSSLTVAPAAYYDLRIAGNQATLGNNTSVANKLILDYYNTNDGDTIKTGLIIPQYVSLDLLSTSSIVVENSSGSSTHFIRMSGLINDSRSSKTYSGTFEHNTSSYSVIPATYSTLYINQTTALSGNTTVQNLLRINSSQRNLNCLGYTLTINRLSLPSTNTSSNKNQARIDVSSGKLVINGNLNVTREFFGNNTSTTSPSYTNIYALEIKASKTLTLGSDNITVTNELIFPNSNSYINLNGYTFTTNGVITNSSGSNGGKFKGSSSSSIVCGATGTLYFNQSSTDNYLRNLTINNSKTVNLGNQLNITNGSNYGTVIVGAGSQLNTQGFLTLKADASGTARIGESNGVINGDYTAETYLPATGRKYRFLASPVQNGTAAQWRNNGSSSASANIGIQITGSGTGFDNSTTNNPSAFWYDETKAGNDTTVGSGSSNDAGWTALTSGSQTLDNGKGYRVLVRGDRTISLTSSTPGTINPTTIWVKGTYPGYSASSSASQPVVVNVTKTGTNRNSGINLIGNPYPSTIDWNAVTRSANVDAAYITYDPGVSGKGWTAASRYRGWNGSTGGAGRYIAAGQGFMVYTTGSGTVTFEENDKSTVAAGNFFAEKLTNHIIITMAYDSAYLDEAYLHFREDASNLKDQYDLVQMINPTVNVATLDSNGQSYNINSLGKLEGKRVVPINLTNNPVADYKFKFNDLGTFANHRVFLNDKFTNKLFEVFEGNEYPISITSDPLSTGKNRLELVFEPVAANLKRITDNSAIRILNNPVKDILILNVESSHDIGDANIEIFNTNGQLVSQSNWGTNKVNTQVNTSKLAQGIYFINITSKNYSQTIKFTKN